MMMARTLSGIVLLLFLAGVLCTDSMALPPEESDRPSPEQMERVRKRIETLRMWRLTKALDLDEETAARLFPVLHKYDKRRAETERALKEGLRELRKALREGSEARLKELLEELERRHGELQRLRTEEMAELKKILTVEQQARFVIFLQDFKKEIRRIVAEARERRLQRLGKRRPDTPFTERP